MPSKSGLVASLRRPGGNITGMTQNSPELAAKRLELLQETVPGLSRVAVLWHPLHPNTPELFKETQAASQKLGLPLLSLEVKTPEDFEHGFCHGHPAACGGSYRAPRPLYGAAPCPHCRFGDRAPPPGDIRDA